ncbi:uncharacterized protein [Physcomitrium patens]|uniref:uncharacterized protein n=1 Tax=Physcomitrium patens TaxID=3218 RepID=UPI003CCC928E
MERGREGRRGSVGGVMVQAIRRPRTGFKDAAAGDDGDDMMEDGHNGRLRERGKKDGGGVTSSHGAGSSIVGSSSRSKRKRYGSQEKQRQGQGQGRRSPAEEVEETTEDTEMGASEDDDDQPPPIIVRRSGLTTVPLGCPAICRSAVELSLLYRSLNRVAGRSRGSGAMAIVGWAVVANAFGDEWRGWVAVVGRGGGGAEGGV